MEDWKNQLNDLAHSIGEMVLSINRTMTEFVKSETFSNLIEYFRNIPDDIQDTELYKHIYGFWKKEIVVEDVEWIQEQLGYMTLDMSIGVICKKQNPSEVDMYVREIVSSQVIREREKIIVLLAYFESIVFQTIEHNKVGRESVKVVVKENADNMHEMELHNLGKIFLAGIVYIVFSNTDNYKGEIDKNIPFRNNLLHRGAIGYSDDEIRKAYEILVYFIAECIIISEK